MYGNSDCPRPDRGVWIPINPPYPLHWSRHHIHRLLNVETGGNPIWWNDLRPVHAALYAAVAFFAWNGRGDIAWKILAVDVTIGFVAFVIHYQKKNVTLKAYKETIEP
jgi:hypothetical protein